MRIAKDRSRNSVPRSPPNTASRVEQEGSEGIHPQAEQYAGLVGIAFDEHGPGNGETAETEQVADDLYPCRLGVGQAHDALEGLPASYP